MIDGTHLQRRGAGKPTGISLSTYQSQPTHRYSLCGHKIFREKTGINRLWMVISVFDEVDYAVPASNKWPCKLHYKGQNHDIWL
jgi:hypothetical protein